jgi:transcriptional regulator with XRE-family HTH domain
MEQKINQEEAAERCGLHRTYYSGIERGISECVTGECWEDRQGAENKPA